MKICLACEQFSNLATVRALVEAGADIYMHNKFNQTGLDNGNIIFSKITNSLSICISF